ncbi:MAG: hypothetical protein ABI178_04665 [Rhodanobacter sp.]
MRAGIGMRGVLAILLGGVLIHAVLMGSLLAYLHGWINSPMLTAIQIVNMGVPVTVVLGICRTRNSLAARTRNI